MKRWVINKYYRWKYRLFRLCRIYPPVEWAPSHADMFFAMMKRYAAVSPYVEIAKQLEGKSLADIAWHNEEKEE
jgi:hypothetical protein